MNSIIKYLFLLLSILVFAFGCKSENTSSETPFNGRFSHPINEYLPYVESINQIPKDSTINAISSDLKPLFNRSIKFKTEDVFSSITGVVEDSDGNIIVLDSDQPLINKYNAQGDLLFSYRKEGRGPDDLYAPSDIEIDENDHIYIGDSFNYIKVFKSEGDSLSFERTINTQEYPISDLCLLDDKIYIRSVGNNKATPDSTVINTVHVFSKEDNQYIRSFGEPYGSENMRLSYGGKIECNEANDIVMVTFEYFSQVYGYSKAGEFKWASQIETFNGPKVIEEVRNNKSYRFIYGQSENSTSDFLSNLESFKSDYIIVQTTWSDNSDKLQTPKRGVDSYILDVNNGNLLSYQDSLPIIAFRTDQILIENAFGPSIHPHVIIHSLN